MKSADWLILKEIEKLETLIIAQQVQTNKKLDHMLTLLLQELDRYVTPDLEEAIRTVSVRATSIDQKVPD